MGLLFKEVDDGLTLLYLLGLPNIKLLGITTTFGNGTIEQVYSQTKKLVHQIGINTPVKQGEISPGGTYNTPAAKFLVEMVNQYPNEITILAIGPLGNLYAASQIDKDFFHKVQSIVTMGGYLNPVILGRRDLSELNFSANPQASMHVLFAPCPVTVFSAQICLDAPYRLKNIFRAKFWPFRLKIILLQWLLSFGYHTGEMVFYLWDLLPAVYLSEPEIFDIHRFSLASTLSDIKQGFLIEAKSDKNHTISLGKKINDIGKFYSHLELTWQRAIENLNL